MDFAIHQQDGWDISVKAGQFDIPFGIDWRSYASVDRRMVTVPLMVDATHEGWNDLGATLHLERGPLALDAFLVNGSSCGRGQGTCKINREEVVRSFGARLGCVPLEGLELGFSGALFHDLDGTTVMTLWGADGQWRQGPWLVKGEYLQQIADQNTVAEATNDGAYLQVLRELGRTFVFARHDFLVHESKDSPDLQRWELGAGYVVRDGLEVRLEQQLGGASLGDMTWLQMVMTFGANNLIPLGGERSRPPSAAGILPLFRCPIPPAGSILDCTVVGHSQLRKGHHHEHSGPGFPRRHFARI